VVLNVKVKGDGHDALGEEGAVVGEEVVGTLDSDDKGVDVGAGVDLLDLQFGVGNIDQALVDLTSILCRYQG
jgi:hypothetical protein